MLETVVRWFTGGQCNLRCPYCVNSDQERTAVWREVDVDKAVALCREVAPVSTLMILGGEPTCMPWLARAFRQLHAIRRVEILTNGVLVDVLADQVRSAMVGAEHVTVLVTVHPLAWPARSALADAVDAWMALNSEKVFVQVKCLLTSADDVHACTVNDWAAELVPHGHLLVAARRVPSSGPTMHEVVTALRANSSPRLKRLLTVRAENENRVCPYAGRECPVADSVVNIAPWGAAFGVKCGAEQLVYLPWSASIETMLSHKQTRRVVCPDRQLGCNCDATVDDIVARRMGLRKVDYLTADV